jgi:dipeptidyl aminopeptidase/acylaminoacyl peptidase
MVTRSQNLRDLLAAFDCLAAQDGIDPDRLGVVGSSYGGYLGALLVAERQPRWLALQAPALYKDADFDRPKHQLNRDDDLPAYRRRRLARAENLALRSAATFDGDVLLVEAERDDVIPHEVVANYCTALAGARSLVRLVIPEADHGLTQRRWRHMYRDALVRWFAERLSEAPRRLR